MSRLTDYNEYELPEPFDINERNEWGYSLNDAIDQVDDDIIKRGQLTERPSPSESGRLYLDEESLTLYLDDGEKWERFGAQLRVQESQSTVDVNPNTINFDGGFTVTNPSAGTVEVDVNDVFVEKTGDSMEGVLDLNSNDLEDGSQTIWDASNEYITQSSLQNDSLTVSAGDGLKNGGSVQLGSSTTLDIEPADFAGALLSDDGSDNLRINLGDGVEGDGSDNLQIDEGYGLVWTTEQEFAGGINASSQQIRNLPEPSAAGDAARKQYVDGVAQGLELKDSAAVATDGTSIDLTTSADPNPIDGYTLSDGERVLLKNQTNSVENGIYVAQTATDPTTWTRAADFDEDGEVTNGTFAFVENGTNNGSSSWIVTSDDPIAVGTDNIVWSQFAAAGEITAGLGLSRTGQTLDVNVGTGVEENADNVRLDEDYSASWTTDQTFEADVLDGAGNTVYDQSETHVPQTRLENDSITVTAGTQLTGGGTVALGGSTTIDLDQGSGSGLNADTVDGFESDELRNANNVAQLTSTDTSTDINQGTWTSIPWDVQQILDGAYSHDGSGNPETITFDEDGRYRVYVSLSYDSNGNSRINPGIKFNVNGTRLDTFGLTGYVREMEGHSEGSNTVSRVIEVSAGDSLKVQTIEQGNAGTVTMRSQESVLLVEQLNASTAVVSNADTLDGFDATAFVKTDGSTPITSAQAINQANGNDFLKLNNTTSGDTIDLTIDGSNNFELDINDSEVFEVDPDTLQTTFQSRVTSLSGYDAGGSSIDNSTEVNTPGGGGQAFTVYDSANAQDLAVFNEGGNVTVPNGKLSSGQLLLHSLTLDESVDIPAGYGTVVAESLSGSGSLTGSGKVVGLDSINTTVQTPMQQPLDTNGYPIEDSTGSINFADAQNLEPTSEPTTPTNGTKLFVDSADDNLKAKDESGDVVTLVTT